MSRIVLILAIALALVLPVQAQTQARLPDYRVSVIEPPSVDGDEFVVEFGVLNIGGDAVNEASAILTVATTGEQLSDIQRVRPLKSNESESVTFRFSAPPSFQPGSAQSIQLTVGIDEIEPRGGPNIANNSARTGLTVPGNMPTAVPTSAAAQQDTSGNSEGTAPGGSRASFVIPVINFRVDLTNPGHILIVVGVIGIIIVLLWVATIILRLMFQKSPTMGTWQPPYAVTTMIDPDSTLGRRQLWQQHAQNDALLTPCADGSYTIRKLLLGTDGTTFSGWTLTAMRLNQYDMYGRVARTQTLAANDLIKKLNKASHRRQPLDEVQAYKTMRSVARGMVSQFEKHMSKKNAMLPVAMDVRFKGTHGEARILFELFGCRRGQWQMIDQWEPEMIVIRGAIYENFTYSMFGQQPNEDYKAFRQRFEDELTRTLAEMVTRQRAMPERAPVAAPPVEMPSAERYVPQDTAPNPPIA